MFKNVDEQIELLRSRGLTIDDEEKTRLYLLTNNYYNIVNGYGKFFHRQGDNYTNGTSFDEISRLYLLDKNMKQSMFQAILAAESHMKAIFAYRFAESFKDNPYAYLNTDSYDANKILSVVHTIYRLSGTVKHYQGIRDSSIYHYVNNHGNVPIWVLVNYLNFGELRAMITSVKPNLQNTIAKDFFSFVRRHIKNPTIFTPETMVSFIENINDVRNVCAHNNRLIDFRCKRDSKYWSSLHDTYGISADSPRNKVFSVFVSLKCFLSVMEYGTMHNKILKEFKRMSNRASSIAMNDILIKYGFPDDWHNITPKIDTNKFVLDE